MFGPLFQLHWLGVLCPCLQKDEDRNARQALTYINASGKRILWIRTSSSSSSTSGGGFLGGLFRKNSNDSSSSTGPTRTVAKLSLQDNANGIPEVLIDPTAVIPLGGGVATDGDTQDGAISTSSQQQQQQQTQERPLHVSASSSFKLNLKLHRIDKVTLEGENDIVLRARPVKSSSDSGHSAKELLRFHVLNSNDDCPIKSEERNMFVHHMAVLAEWERQRRAANPDEYYDYDENDDEDEANQPNFLQARASKAAHFAKRELELQQTRREREKRKAKLVAESGGLKYTALAMAKS